MSCALVLAADASASVGWDEFNLIAGGLAAALREAEIVAALTREGGSHAAVLIFSGRDAQDVAVPWTRIGTEAEAARFADAVDAMPRLAKPGLTAIGDALLAAGALLATLTAPVRRRVIDVAADGRANDGIAPAEIRDRLVAAGVTVNGLCVLHEEPDLVATFTREVIGGPGAFAQPCPDFHAFADAMRRKLLREVRDVPVA